MALDGSTASLRGDESKRDGSFPTLIIDSLKREQVMSCVTLMIPLEMECSWSSTQFHQDRVAAKLEELRQAHTSEEVAASADLDPRLDVVALHFSRLLKLLRTDCIK